ncbi:MAG TPA: hypothetical protein VND22_06165 [Actinomycetota bacterium]|nr:hypothetical protein [Actinomycetota bacterium]
MARFRALVIAISIGLTSFLALSPAAPAGAQYPPTEGDLIVDKTVVVPGGTIDVEGGGFGAGVVVAVSLECPDGETQLGTFTTDENGNFKGQVRIPENQRPGSCILRARGQGANLAPRTLSARITVRAADAARRTPRTGLEIPPWVMFGVALIMAGGLALVFTKGRRSHA